MNFVYEGQVFATTILIHVDVGQKYYLLALYTRLT
jgi:hypothetical protein